MSTLEHCDSISPKTPARKRGRWGDAMPYGNVGRKAQKGFYLSEMGRDMVQMLQIWKNGATESQIVDDAIRAMWLQVKGELERANIDIYSILEFHHYIIPKWLKGQDRRVEAIKRTQ